MKLPQLQSALLALAALVASACVAQAQNYPSRPVTIVVPFPAGGSIDTVARVLAERMKARSGSL